MTDEYAHTFSAMGTVVTIQVVGHGGSREAKRERESVIARAAEWFNHVERCCSRFDRSSEVSRLTNHVGEAVSASDVLFEAVRFSLAVAEESGGAFDPTVGRRMESLGFDQEHRTGATVRTDIPDQAELSYRDVEIDEELRTITLRRPLVLDLGAVAKGLAIDMAARELAPFENFAVDAGGDLYLGGHNALGEPWSVGIRHPRDSGSLFETLRVSDRAVCTSGDYERVIVGAEQGPVHHLIDPKTGLSVSTVASVTVLASSAMVADALATAAFVLGPTRGIAMLERHDVDGIIVMPSLDRFTTGELNAGGLTSFNKAHAVRR